MWEDSGHQQTERAFASPPLCFSQKEELELEVRLTGNQHKDAGKSDPPGKAGEQRRAELSPVCKSPACLPARAAASHQQDGAVNKPQ